MAYTQTDIDALKAAMATGALQTRLPDGRYVQFRSLSEMQTQLTAMELEVNGGKPRQSRFVTSKGLLP